MFIMRSTDLIKISEHELQREEPDEAEASSDGRQDRVVAGQQHLVALQQICKEEEKVRLSKEPKTRNERLP